MTYPDWLEQFDVLKPEDNREAKRHLAVLDLPDLLVLFVVSRKSLSGIERAIVACQESHHPGWHSVILLAPDISSAESDALRESLAAERRVSLATSALEADAAMQRFHYCLLCAGSVLLNPLAGYMFLEAAVRIGADAVYSDHDCIDESGARHDPSFKPQFSPNISRGPITLAIACCCRGRSG